MKSGSQKRRDQSQTLDLAYSPNELPKHFEVVLEGERQVLGELLSIHDSYYQIDDVMKSHFFYQTNHQIIYEAVEAMHALSITVDLKSMVHYLRSQDLLDKAGGAAYLAQLVSHATGNINKYVHGIIREEYLRRKVIEICTRAAQRSQDPANDIFETLDRVGDETSHLNNELQSRKAKDLKGELINLIDDLEKNLAKDDQFTGVPSGFVRLDRLTQGWQKSDLIIIAARPGMGKTSLVVSMMLNAAIHFDKPAVLFSLEMSTRQILQRMISNIGDVEMDNWKKRGIDFNSEQDKIKFQEDVMKWSSRISQSETLFIDDTPSITLNELRNKAKKYVREHGVELIVVDYLQLMKDSGDGSRNDNREQVISAISRGLKALAKELDVPVIALSQLSRAVETRGGDKRPILSDLRESGSIEQDADFVMFVYRPEYYGITMDEMGSSTEGQAEFIIAKHRNGSLDNVKARYLGKYVRFEDW